MRCHCGQVQYLYNSLLLMKYNDQQIFFFIFKCEPLMYIIKKYYFDSFWVFFIGTWIRWSKYTTLNVRKTGLVGGLERYLCCNLLSSNLKWYFRKVCFHSKIIFESHFFKLLSMQQIFLFSAVLFSGKSPISKWNVTPRFKDGGEIIFFADFYSTRLEVFSAC